MRYSTVLLLTVALFAALAIGLLAYPAGFAALFGLEPSTGAEVMARRAGVIFAALTPLFLALSRVPDRSLQRAVAQSGVVMMAGLAVLGLIEWAAGRVGPGIFPAVAAETVFALLYARLALGRT